MARNLKAIMENIGYHLVEKRRYYYVASLGSLPFIIPQAIFSWPKVNPDTAPIVITAHDSDRVLALVDDNDHNTLYKARRWVFGQQRSLGEVEKLDDDGQIYKAKESDYDSKFQSGWFPELEEIGLGNQKGEVVLPFTEGCRSLNDIKSKAWHREDPSTYLQYKIGIIEKNEEDLDNNPDTQDYRTYLIDGQEETTNRKFPLFDIHVKEGASTNPAYLAGLASLYGEVDRQSLRTLYKLANQEYEQGVRDALSQIKDNPTDIEVRLIANVIRPLLGPSTSPPKSSSGIFDVNTEDCLSTRNFANQTLPNNRVLPEEWRGKALKDVLPFLETFQYYGYLSDESYPDFVHPDFEGLDSIRAK